MSPRAYKEMGLTAASLLLGALALFSLAIGVSGTGLRGAWLVLTLVLAIIWLDLLALSFAMVANKWLAGTLVIGLPLVVALAGRLSLGSIGGGILLLPALLAARQAITQEILNRIAYRTFQIFRPGLYWLVIGMLVAGAGLIFSNVEKQVSNANTVVSEAQVSAMLEWLAPLLDEINPELRDSRTVSDMLERQLKQQLGPNAAVTEGQRALALQQLSRQLNRELSGQESMAQIVAQKINLAVNQITRSNPLMVTLLVIVLILLTIKTLVPLVVLPLTATMIVAVWLSNLSGLTKVSELKITATRLELE